MSKLALILPLLLGATAPAVWARNCFEQYQVRTEAVQTRSSTSRRSMALNTHSKGETICVLEKIGRWVRTERGWIPVTRALRKIPPKSFMFIAVKWCRENRADEYPNPRKRLELCNCFIPELVKRGWNRKKFDTFFQNNLAGFEKSALLGARRGVSRLNTAIDFEMQCAAGRKFR